MKLILNDVKKTFGEKIVLSGADYSFEAGKIYGLLGRNGAGKTTLFNCLSGELDMDHGKALLCDGDSDESGLGREIQPEEIGYVFSTPILPEFLTGYEFLKFYKDVCGQKDDMRSVDEYFDIVKVDREDRGRLIKGYSHGMKNKLQMLCFIIAKPPVVLLDEPLTSLDVVVALEIKNLLMELKEDRIIIFSTHILQLATDLCDEIAVLSNGKLTRIDGERLHSPEFEAQVVEMLKDENGEGEDEPVGN